MDDTQPADVMETLSEAVRRLQAEGYDGNWYAAEDGTLQCGECGAQFDPREVTVDGRYRFEGESDPADMSILYALSAPCGHRGLYSANYGPEAMPADVAVIRRMERRGDAASETGGGDP